MSLFIATPILGRPESEFAESIAVAMATFVRDGVPFERFTVQNDSMVHRARNAIAHRFLASECTHMLMVDSDMVFRPEDVLSLAHADVDVVGGVCSRKVLGSGPVLEAIECGETRDDGLVEVSRIGTGFLLVSRHALERIAEAFPDDVYVARHGDADHAGQEVHAFFQSPLVGRELVSEDYFFCDRWRSIGGKVWAHAGVRPGHIGSYVYGGT